MCIYNKHMQNFLRIGKQIRQNLLYMIFLLSLRVTELLQL